MSISNPTSPHKHIGNQHQHQPSSITDNTHLIPTRIPKPSPHLIRRSFSLRLRNTTTNMTAAPPTNCEICTKNIDVVDDNVLATAAPSPTSSSTLSENLQFFKNSTKLSSSQIKHSKSCPFATMTHYSNNNNCVSFGNKKTEITSPLSPRKNVQTIAKNKCISGKSDINGETVVDSCAVKSTNDVNFVQEKISSNSSTSENGLVSCCCFVNLNY